MKNWLKNTLIVGGILAGSLKGFSQADKDFNKYISDSSNWKTYQVHEGIKQPEYCSNDTAVKAGEKEFSWKEAKKKLGVKYITEIKNLGHGYVTSKPEYGGFNKNYNNLRIIQGLEDNSIQLEYNGKRGIIEGTLCGEPSKEVLEKVDHIEKDYILTTEEISKSLKKEYENAFKEYASKELNVPKDSLVEAGKGYVTSKNLERLLKATGNLYEKISGESIENLYEIISKEDRVLSEKEILSVAKAMKNYLDKE